MSRIAACTLPTFCALLTACSAPSSMPTAPEPTDPVAGSYAALPAAVDCGTTTTTSPAVAPLVPAEGVACVRAGLAAGRTVTVTTTSPTSEGDPITRHHRIGPRGAVDVWSDATHDRFGAGTWSHEAVACPATERTADPVVVQLCAARAPGGRG